MAGKDSITLREAWTEGGDTTDMRLAWEEPDTSLGAIWILGMILSIMVYFSPCAFPVLPGFISYYLSWVQEKMS